MINKKPVSKSYLTKAPLVVKGLFLSCVYIPISVLYQLALFFDSSVFYIIVIVFFSMITFCS